MSTERQLFLENLAQTSDFPMGLEVLSADGIYIKDKSGKKFIDLISGIGVSAVGHRHPKVIEAINSQLEKHLHVMVYGEYIQSPQVQLARALSKTFPDPINSTFFVNSGSEAIEGAIKLAKRYTGKFEIITCKNAYHGSSHGALSASGNEGFKRNFRPLVPGFSQINYGDFSDLETITADTAAVLIETVQGEAGVRFAATEYFKNLEQRCRETGSLLIMDEIQCGFGRTGDMWAFEQHGIIPDIVAAAKGMGGGMPIGSFSSSSEIMSSLKNDPILGHISTFGGHPVSCAASLATLKTIQEESLLAEISGKENFLRDHLIHPSIKEIRSRGLMMAVEFESFDFLQKVISSALKVGVISDWFLFCDNSMRIAPPLTITYQELEIAVEKILEAIDLAQSQ